MVNPDLDIGGEGAIVMEGVSLYDTLPRQIFLNVLGQWNTCEGHFIVRYLCRNSLWFYIFYFYFSKKKTLKLPFLWEYRTFYDAYYLQILLCIWKRNNVWLTLCRSGGNVLQIKFIDFSKSMWNFPFFRAFFSKILKTIVTLRFSDIFLQQNFVSHSN